MLRTLFPLLAVGMIALVALSTVAAAQDASLPPSYGSHYFPLDKRFHLTKTLRAGGMTFVNFNNGQCTGHISQKPDLVLNLQSSDSLRKKLTIRAFSETDTFLLVQNYDGNFTCDDDSAGRRNPSLDVSSAAKTHKPTVKIWVGTFARYSASRATNPSPPTALWAQSELETRPVPDYVPPFYTNRDAYNGRKTLTDRGPDQFSLRFQAGGKRPVYFEKDKCQGFITEKADLEIELDSKLRDPKDAKLLAYSAVDTILVIRDPEGWWYCNDNSGGYKNPALNLDFDRGAHRGGIYKVWVGPRSGSEAKDKYGWEQPWVSIWAQNAETGRPPPYSPDPHRDAETKVASAQAPIPNDKVNLFEAGPIDTRDIVVDLAMTLPGLGCHGHTTIHPNGLLNWANTFGTGRLNFYNHGLQIDTVLLVYSRGRIWRCDDDGSEGWNDLVVIPKGTRGQHRIWAGTFARQHYDGIARTHWSYSSSIYASQLHTR